MTLVKKIKDKKVNFEFNKEFIKVVTDKISSNDAEFITNSFNDMHPADAADIIEHLSENDRENLIKLNNFKVDRKILITINSKNISALKELKSVSGINNKGGDSSLKRIGNFIKEARLSKNQSIEELASDLKIRTHQLEAIEEGNEEKLPEKVFIKAMIRRISQKLKLDTEFIMDEFKTERKEVKIEEIVEEVSKKNYKTRQSKNFNPLGFLIFILISGFIGLIASSLIFNLFSDSSQNQTPKQELIKKTK